MTAVEDTTTHTSWVRVAVEGIGFDVAFRDGGPAAVRFVSSAGMPAPWWLIETLDPHTAHARAARAAGAFVAQFRGVAG